MEQLCGHHSQNLQGRHSQNSINNKQILSLKSKISDQEFIEFIYSIDPKTYLIDFSIRSKGMSSYIDSKENPLIEIKNRGHITIPPDLKMLNKIKYYL